MRGYKIESTSLVFCLNNLVKGAFKRLAAFISGKLFGLLFETLYLAFLLGPYCFGFFSQLGLSSSSRLISQSLADDTGDRFFSAGNIVDAETASRIIPEIKL